MKVLNYKIIALSLIIIFIVTFLYDTYTSNIRHDFRHYYRASKGLLAGKDIYDKKAIGSKFKYLPILAILIVPFSFFDIYLASALWYSFNCLLIYYIILLTLRIVYNQRGMALYLILLPIAFAFRFFWENLKHGQINLAVFFLTVWGLYHFRARRDFWAGFTIALASSLKFTPFLFLAYFLFKREYKMMLGAFIGLLCFVLIVPSIVLGPGNNVDSLVTYVSKRQVEISTVGREDASGHSLHAILYSFLTEIDAAPKGTSNMYVNLFNLEKNLITILILLISLFLLALGLYLARGRLVDRESKFWPIEFALVFLLMLLISPESRRAHFVSLFFPFTIISYLLWRVGLKGKLRQILLYSLIVCLALIFLCSKIIGGLYYYHYAGAFRGFGWAALVLFIGLAISYYYLRKESEENIVAGDLSQYDSYR